MAKFTRSDAFGYLVGIGGLLLITFPFLWFTLDQNYEAGTTRVVFSFAHGLTFFTNLLPIAILALLVYGILFAIKRFQVAEKMSHGYSIVVSTLLPKPEWRRLLAHWWPTGACLALFAAPLALSHSGLNEWTVTCLFMLLAVGLNITVGMTGILVLGYAGFYAFGAYFFAVGQEHFSFFPWWLALPISFIFGGVIGFLIGLPCLRLRGDYLAIVTLGFAEAFRKTIENLDFFNGPKGISISSAAGFSRIPGTVISSGTVAYWVTLLALILTVMLVQRLRASPIGRAWVAIRENEIAASAMGIPVVSLKLLAFALSAAIASAAGVLYDAREGFISPALCQFQISVMILAMVILGGLGNTYGALVGAALLYLAPEYMKLLPSLVHNTPALSFIPSFITDALQHLEDYRLLIFGILMVVVMLYRPQGLLGTARRRVEIKEGT